MSGIVFVVLLVLGFAVFGGDTPDIDDSGSKIVAYYNDHQGSQITAAILVSLSTLFLAVFVVSLRDYLRSTGTGGDFWPTIALVGGVVSVAGFLVAVGVHVALIDGGDKNISPDAMVALNAIDNDNFFAFALPLGIMMLGATGAILKAGAALPRWLGWAALVLFIVQFTPAGFFAFGLTGIWIIVAGIIMYRSSAAPAAPGAPPAAPPAPAT
ncbi:MAG: hypothetical protein ACJ75Z_05055 [Solirubrobacterales bacterium]